MSIIGSNVLAGASGSGVSAYEIEQSLRFDGSQKLSRTPSSAGTTTTWTLSYWIKAGDLTAEQAILSANPSAGGYTATWYSSGATSRLKINQYNHPTNVYSKCPTPVYRDPSAWFHVVVVFDSTNATADDRVRFYVNGVRQTDFSDDGSSVGGTTNPSQNQESGVNHNAVHYIGSQYDGTYAFAESYLAEMHLLDGTAVTNAEDFGEYDDNGVWRPIEYTGDSYGTNGFYLKFDETATNGIGHDHSGNGNNWTAYGFTTSGTGTDVMSDTPTKNFPTLNPLDNLNGRFSNDPTNGNLEVSIPSDSVSKRNFPGFYSTQAIPTTGKFYFEFKPSQEYTTINIVDVDEVGTISSGDHVGASDKLSFQYFCESGNYRFNGTSTASGLGGFSSENIYGVAVDLENETFRVYENGIAGSELSVSGYLGADARIAPSIDSSGASGTVTMNFGQREFAYPPGTASATDYFNAIIWTGDGSNPRTLTGVGFQPDLVWIKARSAGGDLSHQLFDAVRGLSGGNSLQPDRTVKEGVEGTGNGYLSAFTSDGFTVDTTSSDIYVNDSGKTYVAWCWKAGGSGSSNNTGTLDATVSASQDAGFSIVTFSGGGSAGTVAHGLSSAPKFYIVKNRSSTTAYNWYVYTETTGTGHFLKLNDTTGKTASNDPFNNTAPTSSVFSVGGENVVSGVDYVAYCWEEKTGVSKFGSYTGNGSSTGPFIECGFKPRMVIVKRTDAASNWFIYDTVRGTNNKLYADDPSDENGEDGGSTSSNTILSLSTGFQMTSGNGSNTSGGTYTFMAWAETYSADADFKSLNTANLPAPEVKDGSDNFNTVLYTGTGTTNARTDVGFQPDLTWIKLRNAASSHSWYDVLRGPTKVIGSNATSAESTDGSVTPTSTGFTLGSENSSFGSTNGNGYNYVAWNWLAGGSGSSNTNGSITSTVSANASAGFSIVSYTGTGSTATVGHGLGVAPSVIIFKNRDDGGTYDNWSVYHSAYSPSSVLYLNTQDQLGSASSFFDTAPTSTVFQVKTENKVNGSGDDHIAYCFAEVEGYSKFGSYSGNGNSNGPFVYTGFKPAWLMVKKNANSTDWKIYDAGRESYNVVANRIAANTSGAELDGNAQEIDFVSNGFKFRGTNGDQNSSGTFYYIAFASHPFGGSGVSPATAR